MKKALVITAVVALLVLTLAGCDLFRSTDLIVGSWQQVSVDGTPPLLVTVVEFTEDTYTGSTGGVPTNSGTWTKSGSAYTLNGSFFGFISATSTFTPVFSSSNNTLTFTDENNDVQIYNRQ